MRSLHDKSAPRPRRAEAAALMLLSRAQMQALDQLTIDSLGISGAALMEVAGRAVAEAAVLRLAETPGRVVALVGPGNNGGDAVVAARHLAQRGHPVELVVIGEQKARSKALKEQLAIAFKLGLAPNELSKTSDLGAWLQGAGVVLDGLFGTGLSRPIGEPFASAIQILNESEVAVVAVDMPSGIDADTGQVLGVAVWADTTVTFQHGKPGQFLFPGRAQVGTLAIVDIGLPPSLLAQVQPAAALLDQEILAEAFPPRGVDSHKGSFGHLLLVAGTPDRPGSALLAGRAALRVGTGLVTLASDPSTVGRIAGVLEELMGLSLSPLNGAEILAALAHKTAIAIGPSLVPGPALRATVLEVLQGSSAPVVLDAGALSAFAGAASALADHRAPLVLTPHPGEAARLLGLDTVAVQADRLQAARALAEQAQAIVVLKGAGTVVASPDGRVALCRAGNAGMATGGTGDVLTGVIGGLLAQGVEAEGAARAGVQLHAQAGDRAAALRGEAGLVASDLHPALGEILRDHAGSFGA